MPQKNRVEAATLASFLGSALTTAYQVVNTSGLPAPCFMLRIINSSSLPITISYDGSTSHDILPTLETLQITTQNNSLPYTGVALFPKKMKVYVKSTGAGTGTIWVTAYYQVI